MSKIEIEYINTKSVLPRWNLMVICLENEHSRSEIEIFPPRDDKMYVLTNDLLCILK